MIARKLASAAAASLTAAMLLTGASAAVASASASAAVHNVATCFGTFYGTGSTLADAEADARQQAHDAGYFGSGILEYSSDSGGVWTVAMRFNCVQQ